MAKYFKFVYDADAGISESLLVDNLQYIHTDIKGTISFIPSDFNNQGVVQMILNQEDPRRKVKTYLEEQWETLINSNQTFIDIPIRELPATETSLCEDNTWQFWELTVAFDPTDCDVILSATIEPEGLGTITIGEPIIIEGKFRGYYAQATGTPCGTQDLVFLQGSDCGAPGQPVLEEGFEEYVYTGQQVGCEGEGGEPVSYCLIAKPVFKTTGFTGTLSFGKITVPEPPEEPELP